MSGAAAPAASAAILFQADEFTLARSRIMGRHSANEGFALAWARHASCAEFHACVPSQQDWRAFEALVNAPAQRAGRPPARVHFLPYQQPELLAVPGLLHLPDPSLARHALRRQFHAGASASAYSLSGVTHTLSSRSAMALVAEMLSAPLQPWDALICTSKAARSTVDFLLSRQAEYLADLFSIPPPRPRLQLPVIPLGVDCGRFLERDATLPLRGKWRARLGVGEDDFTVLYFGRLSFHAKANPFPLYRALQIARRRTGRTIHLLMVGQASNPDIAAAFRAAAAAACPDVAVHFLDGGDTEAAREIWYAADAFASLSDNIQETFGLTPVEAMAAGLPCVVSDWDGYRETVVHGECGFLIPTCAPPASSAGGALARRYALDLDNYDHYIANVSKTVAVDITAAAAAFETLIREPALRRGMGERGRRRALQHYDWRHIIAAYEALWRELGERRQAARQSAGERSGPRSASPFHPDPFALFAAHASASQNELLFRLDEEPGAGNLQALLCLKVLNHGLPLSRAALERIVATLAEGALDLAGLQARLSDVDRALLSACLGWLLKAGVVRGLPRK